MEDLVAYATRRPATRRIGHPIVLRDRTESTNDDVRAAAVAGAAAGYTLVADTQTHGRGRHGRVWHSPPGENLYLSVLLRPVMRPEDAPILTLAAGLAVHDALVPFVEPASRVTIKWPNDVRIDGRKVSGVLVEGSLRGATLAYVVVGIGVNVRGTSLPDEIASTATTLRMSIARDVSRAEVLDRLLVSLEARMDQLERDGGQPIVEAMSARCDTLGTDVSTEGVRGRALAIAADGALRIECADGTVRDVRAGEVVAVG